jgi:dolichyl-phosphate-mannose-protein mannosyltransferase
MQAVPPQDAPREAATGTAVLFVILAAATCVRLYHVTDPLLEFHPTRQYRSAVIARGLYLPHDTSLPGWAREVAELNADQGALEPPIVEHLAVYGYRLTGGERLWIGRLIGIIGWLIGGVAIWRLGRRMMSTLGTVWAVTVFLLTPYAVLASRSFQPDALMTGVTAVAILQIVRFASHRSPWQLSAAILATAVAALIKPMSLFFTVGCFAAVAWPARRPEELSGMSAGTPRRLALQAGAFLLLSIAPTAAYYAYGLFVAGNMQQESGGRFLPLLLLTRFFWSGWWTQAQAVAGGWLWLLAATGVLTARPGLPRRLLAGLCAGYLLFGLTFTYHVATHDYYHLPALIVVALGAGAAVSWIVDAAARIGHRRTAAAVAALLVLVTAAIWVQRSMRTLRDFDRSTEVAIYQRIGDIVRHSQHTIMLAHDYGLPIRYHGHVTGPSWPSAGDLSAAELGAGAGAAEDSAWSSDLPSAEQRFDKFYAADGPEFFLITDFESFGQQPDLRQWLDVRFERIAEEAGFLIYDLRRRSRGLQR